MNISEKFNRSAKYESNRWRRSTMMLTEWHEKNKDRWALLSFQI